MKFRNQAAKYAVVIASTFVAGAAMADTTVDVTPITGLQTTFATISVAVMATIGVIGGGFAVFRLVKRGIKAAV